MHVCMHEWALTTIINNKIKGTLLSFRDLKSTCLDTQISTGEARKVKHTCMFPQRKEMFACLLPRTPRGLGGHVVYSLVIFCCLGETCSAHIFQNLCFYLPRPFPLNRELCFSTTNPSLWVVSLGLHNSLSDFHVILGPGQSWLPRVLRSPKPFSLDFHLERCF